MLTSLRNNQRQIFLLSVGTAKTLKSNRFKIANLSIERISSTIFLAKRLAGAKPIWSRSTSLLTIGRRVFVKGKSTFIFCIFLDSALKNNNNFRSPLFATNVSLALSQNPFLTNVMTHKNWSYHAQSGPCQIGFVQQWKKQDTSFIVAHADVIRPNIYSRLICTIVGFALSDCETTLDCSILLHHREWKTNAGS